MHLLEKVSLEIGQGQLARDMVERQLALLVEHQSLRSSRRLVSFLEYVVRKALDGEADQLKERTIGVDVFDRDPDYDTGSDHIVRTAASELRKRLAVYYRDDIHRAELKIDIPAGAYVPQFTFPEPTVEPGNGQFLSIPAPTEGRSDESYAYKPNAIRKYRWLLVATVSFVILGTAAAFLPQNVGAHKQTPQMLFWGPVIRESGPAVIVVPIYSPHITAPSAGKETSVRGAAGPQEPKPPYAIMPACEALTMARIASVFGKADKPYVIRSERSSSFSDLQSGPTVLLGYFTNEWALRLTRNLRFSPILDRDSNQIYIRDNQNPGSRAWAVDAWEHPVAEVTRASGQSFVEYALISRVINPDTGKFVVIVGGLHSWGSEAAGQFLGDSQLENLTGAIPLDQAKRNLQIVLETNVTEGVPGRPRIVAYSVQ